MFNTENVREYPNFYNFSLLLATGYKVEDIVKSGNHGQFNVVLRKSNPVVFASRERERSMFIVDLFAGKTSQGVCEFTEQVLLNVNMFLKSDQCTLKETTKESLKTFISLQAEEPIRERILSGAFSHNAERILQKINANKDVAYDLNRFEGTTSLSNAFDRLAKNTSKSSIYDFSEQQVPSGEYIVNCVTTVLKGEDLTQTMSMSRN